MSHTSDDPPRLLAIMGSGETAPTMAKVHRLLLGRSGPPPVPAVMLDTPYGFQENADEITARALDYFRENVGWPMTLGSWRTADLDPVDKATTLARLQDAHYVFAGPGSPSYALRQWRGSGIDDIVVDKLTRGGVATFASAAALTLGAFTVPVYEIYKVGEAPTWLPGLDILGRLGLPVAVIPHYDNAEGGSHDTRFCYLGERRLAALEAMLPETHFVLGVDSHTALLIDFVEGTARVLGLGGATVRVQGRSAVFPPGSSVPLGELGAAAERLRGGGAGGSVPVGASVAAPAVVRPASEPAGGAGGVGGRSPLLDETQALSVLFDAATAAGDVQAAVRAVLALENVLTAWSRDTAGTDEIDRARATFQALVVRLGELVPAGAAEAASGPAVPDPVVALLVELRAAARANKDYAMGDRIRDALTAAGIELRDGPDGTTWGSRES
ncbi:MAG: hypothetical protein U0869_15125 [Chloroflexota bacterium]